MLHPLIMIISALLRLALFCTHLQVATFILTVNQTLLSMMDAGMAGRSIPSLCQWTELHNIMQHSQIYCISTLQSKPSGKVADSETKQTASLIMSNV